MQGQQQQANNHCRSWCRKAIVTSAERNTQHSLGDTLRRHHHVTMMKKKEQITLLSLSLLRMVYGAQKLSLRIRRSFVFRSLSPPFPHGASRGRTLALQHQLLLARCNLRQVEKGVCRTFRHVFDIPVAVCRG